MAQAWAAGAAEGRSISQAGIRWGMRRPGRRIAKRSSLPPVQGGNCVARAKLSEERSLVRREADEAK